MTTAATTTEATASTTTGPAGTEGATGRVFFRACAAEWTRLWTVRTTWWFLAAAAVTMIGIAAIAGLDTAGDPVSSERDPVWVISAITAFPAQFALLALALTAVTSDYATGGIVPTLQWTPRRGVLLAARALVTVGTATALGVLLGIVAAVTGFVTAYPRLTLPVGEGLDVLGGVAVVFGAGTASAVGLGLLLRNTAGALVTAFLLMLVLPLLLPQLGYEWTTALADLLPGTAAVFLLLEEGGDMTQTSAILTLLAWAGGLLVVGGARLLRDDANR